MTFGEVIGDDDLGTELDFLIAGVFNVERFLQLMRNYVAFDSGAEGLSVCQAAPVLRRHQAVGATVDAVESDGKAGVVWHTQGSGKSMEMGSTPTRCSTTPSCSTRPSSSSPTAPSSTVSYTTRSPRACCFAEDPRQITTRCSSP